jgi:hypothetical protein
VTINLHPGQQLEIHGSDVQPVSFTTKDVLIIDRPQFFSGTIRNFPDWANIHDHSAPHTFDTIELPSIGSGLTSHGIHDFDHASFFQDALSIFNSQNHLLARLNLPDTNSVAIVQNDADGLGSSFIRIESTPLASHLSAVDLPNIRILDPPDVFPAGRL